MTDLDTLVRTGLDQSAVGVGDIAVPKLAERLTAVRARRSRTRARRRLALVAIAVLVVSSVVVVAATRDRDAGVTAVDTGPDTSVAPSGFHDLGAGWHVLDPGPVPAMQQAAVAWTGRELVVAGDGSAYAYAPATGTWRDLPAPPLGRDGPIGFAWTGQVLVAANGAAGSAHSALWDPASDTWSDLGAIPLARELSARSGAGPRGVGGGPALVWTGSRVLDLTDGAVLDPATDQWTGLALPADVLPYASLLTAAAAWDGREVVASAWSTTAGLAWDPTGSTYREVPGIPAALIGPSPDVVSPSVATAAGGRVVVVNGDGIAASIDAATGSWSALPGVPGMGTGEGCPSSIATVSGQVVVARCDGGPPVVLRDGAWVSIGPPPTTDPCCSTGWLAADGALVSWSTSTDVYNGPRRVYLHAAVWVP